MKYAYDLHIHSVLSPCADELMTPNNILNMAMLNNLDLISVTDHNSFKQYHALTEIAESYDFILIPGVEIQVEKAHILCYFRNKMDANGFDQYLQTNLIKRDFDHINLKEEVVTNVYDESLYCLNYHLISDLDTSFDEILKYLNGMDTVIILSHVDRKHYSALKLINEGNIDLFDGIEITSNTDVETFINENEILKDKTVFQNSDSHTIIDLNERMNFIDLDEKSIDAFFKFFGK